METLPLALLISMFLTAAIVVWIAGVQLANATDILSVRWGLGEAMGGLIMLAIVTNLPEIAITISGALQHNLGIATGNILGGIAIQTVVLVIVDAVGLGRQAALTYRAASLTLVLEGLLVMGVLSLVIMGSQLPATSTLGGISPTSIAITVLWMAGIGLIAKSRQALQWHNGGHAVDGQPHPRGHAELHREKLATKKKHTTQRTAWIFVIASLVTLICGVILERTGTMIAHHVGMDGIVFGATVLAAATALPEVSTGLASAKLGDYQLAVSDIFGGNAFLPVLFLLADAISGTPVLRAAQTSDLYLTGLGILLTAIYTAGLIFREKRQLVLLGFDSCLVLAVFLIGMMGLVGMR